MNAVSEAGGQKVKNGAIALGKFTPLLLAVAYVLSILSSLMLQVLEGQHLPVLGAFLYRAQWSRIRRIDRRYDKVVAERDAIRNSQAAWWRWTTRCGQPS